MTLGQTILKFVVLYQWASRSLFFMTLDHEVFVFMTLDHKISVFFMIFADKVFVFMTFHHMIFFHDI